MSIFGHCSLGIDWVKRHSFNSVAFAKKKGWYFSPGLMGHYFRSSGAISDLAFGHRPNKKEMRRMIKETKKTTKK